MLGTRPTYRPMLAVDIERSAGRGNIPQQLLRERLFGTLTQALADSGVDVSACHLDDGGDGLRVVAPPNLAKATLLHPVAHELAIRLRSLNPFASASARIRVRAAVHAGDVHMKDGQVAGAPLEILARLLDAPPARQALASAPDSATVVLVVSEHVYDDVVRHGYPGIDPASYVGFRCTVKDTPLRAWYHLPGHSVGPEVVGGVAMSRGEESDDNHREPPTPPTDGRPPVWFTNTTSFGPNARVGQHVGYIGSQVNHNSGNVADHAGQAGQPGADDDLRAALADLRALLTEYRRGGSLDDETFAEAEHELRAAETHLRSADTAGRRRFVLALRKLRAVVEGVADLAVRVTAVLQAAGGLR